MRVAADAMVGSADPCPRCRRSRLTRVAERIACDQARNPLTAGCHRKATPYRHARVILDLERMIVRSVAVNAFLADVVHGRPPRRGRAGDHASHRR